MYRVWMAESINRKAAVDEQMLAYGKLRSAPRQCYWAGSPGWKPQGLELLASATRESLDWLSSGQPVAIMSPLGNASERQV